MASKASSDKLSCSFCGKTQDDVKKLIAGPSLYICNECVDLCNDIIEEEIKSEKDTDRDNFLDAAAAVKYGLVDNILNKRDQKNGK